ncbi:MAG: hypothetical protein JSS78_00265 [Bacteroidetes bacterium]|nr:hypothetical protein [Bacteroidota bacterium]
MKKSSLILTSMLVLSSLFDQNIAWSQAKEASQDLSKSARKGILVGTQRNEDGNIRLTYKMKVDKKSDEVNYEDYVFNKDLQFVGIEKTKENKETHPDQKVTSVTAFVGGSNSFNVLSMTLNLEQQVWERIWDYDKQSYKWGKRLSKESVKPKNSDGKYRGFAAYDNDDDGSVLVLASYDKGDNDQFVFLHVSNDVNLTETKVPITGDYSLVYCGRLKSGNIFAVFAPDKGAADIKKYAYVECTKDGKIALNSDFTAPSSNLMIMDYSEANGSLYFIGASDKSDEAYNRIFSSYAPINNPGYSTAANRQMDKYEKRVMGEDFDNLHLLRFTNGKLDFASTTPIKELKNNVVSPASQRKSHPYNGRKMIVQNLTVAPNGDVLVAGQLMDKKLVNQGKSFEYRYYDYVCLQFNNQGKYQAQYAVEKVFDATKDEIFQAAQDFVISTDGKTAYWELMEVKGAKYYASVMDAWNGSSTYSAQYFPRIAKINLQSKTLSEFEGLGEKGKFLVYRNHTSLTDPSNKIRYYFGHDEDFEKVWIGKYNFD